MQGKNRKYIDDPDGKKATFAGPKTLLRLDAGSDVRWRDWNLRCNFGGLSPHFRKVPDCEPSEMNKI